MAVKSRARTEEAKGVRQKEILEAAKRLIDQRGFEGLTISLVANKCGLAKGTLYLYFQTREEILLAVLMEDFSEWFTKMKEHIRTHTKPFGSAFLDVWLANLKDCPRLATSLSYLHLMLEPNISEEFALKWKLFLLAQTKDLHYEILQRFRAPLTLEELARFLSVLTGLTTGLWMQSSGPKQMQKIYKAHPELKIFSPPFEETFRASAECLLVASPVTKLSD